ncbi:MAG TPA: RNA methyltransferase [Burkholderiales bacterium]|nr:RNA methyltransferase [Burkholderiales bacterium]
MTRSGPLDRIRVVLCETSHPGNIGAAARAMKTMGLADLRLVVPQRFPDPEARWRAARALDVLDAARVHATLDEALRGTALAVACTARTREIGVQDVAAREAAARVVGLARAQPVAIVFGNETNGLTAEQVMKCGLIASIPANPEYASLNLAAAVQVFAYELRLAALDPGAAGSARALAPHEDVEAFYAYLESLMSRAGFLNPEQPKKLMPRLRRLFARAGLEREEVNILRGLLKAISRPKE